MNNMNNKQTYLIPRRDWVEIEVDFEKIHNYLLNEKGITDPDEMYNYFGDNVDWFLRNVLDIHIDDSQFTDEDYMYEDDIWSEFGEWLDKKYENG